MPVHSLGYLYLDVTDLDEWRQFAGGFLGLQEVPAAEPDTLCFRLDGFHHRLAVTLAPEPGLRAAGFQVSDSADLDAMLTRLDQAEVIAREGTKEERAQRKVEGLVLFDDPAGNPIELFHGPAIDHSEVITPGVSAFVTADQGMGHIILNVPDIETCLRFYRDVLGFEERNTTHGQSGKLYFLGCNPRQHTLGLAPAHSAGLLHFMVEAATLDDVGRAYDRALSGDVAMMQSLGRHTNDHMVSFYVWSPENIAVEFGYDGDRVSGRQPSFEITQGALWGHHFTPPPDRQVSRS